jgi:hypothetical protein
MAEELAEPKRHRQITWALLAVAAALVVAVVIVGLNDVSGYILGWLATAIIFFTVTRTWRRIRWFLILLAASFLGIIFLSFLYMEVISRLAVMIGGDAALESLQMRVVQMIITYLIIFAGAMGMFVGVAGSLILLAGRIRGMVFKRT